MKDRFFLYQKNFLKILLFLLFTLIIKGQDVPQKMAIIFFSVACFMSYAQELVGEMSLLVLENGILFICNSEDGVKKEYFGLYFTNCNKVNRLTRLCASLSSKLVPR